MRNRTKPGAVLFQASAKKKSEENPLAKQSRRSKKLAWAGLGLCGLCCSLPLIGAIAGIGFFTAIAAALEMIAILLLGLAAVFFAYAWFRKNKTGKRAAESCGRACAVDCSCSTATLAEKKEQF